MINRRRHEGSVTDLTPVLLPFPAPAHALDQFAGRDVDPPNDADCREMQGIVDAELGRLPEKYRAPLVLCFLEGKSHVEAAQQLTWPVGTFKSRLVRGRELLHNRLIRRGVALSAGALAFWLAEGTARSAVPASLAAAATKAALSEAIPAGVALLAGAVLKGMAVGKLKLVLIGALAAGLLGAAAGTWRNRCSPGPSDHQVVRPIGRSLPCFEGVRRVTSATSYTTVLSVDPDCLFAEPEAGPSECGPPV
jgi:hypothetical protein